MSLTSHIDLSPLKGMLGRTVLDAGHAGTKDIAPKALDPMSGDDLLASRAFVDAARADVTDLLDPDNHNLSNITARLGRIITLSKGVSARAIDRAADAALDMSKNNPDFEKSAQWQGQILVLNKLIAQYGTGLEQVEAELDNARHANTPVVAESEIVSAETFADELDIEPSEAFTTARETLTPLLKFAQSDAQRSALMRLAKIDTRDVKPDAPKSELSSEDLEVKASAPIAKPVFTKPKITSVPFEAVMRNFTTQTLRAARQSDKIVSVSYGAVGQTDIPVERSAAVDTVLSALADGLVSQWLERPELRQARGEAGAGHIAVTATGTAKTLSISFALSTAVGLDFNDAALRQSLGPLDGELSSTLSDRSATLVLSLSRQLAKPAVKESPKVDVPTLDADLTLGDILSEGLV
ncbi:hypothetical protein [Fretibacter rubidus]|uniref:hypothetical protein n=1 Tax=Fretibacter rubidus TaxID=570162 RepID=UPI00352B2486